MAEENLSEDRFKSEVMRLLNALMLKVDAHDKRFDTLENRFDWLEQKVDAHDKRFDTLEKKIDTLSA